MLRPRNSETAAEPSLDSSVLSPSGMNQLLLALLPDRPALNAAGVTRGGRAGVDGTGSQGAQERPGRVFSRTPHSLEQTHQHRLWTRVQLSGSEDSPTARDRLPAASYRDVQQGRLLDKSADSAWDKEVTPRTTQESCAGDVPTLTACPCSRRHGPSLLPHNHTQ